MASVFERWAGEAEVRRLRTLYQLVSTLSRAAGLEQVYEAAIDSLRDATEADRSSILVFDSAGVMQFKAWTGLSSEFRAATTGNTPWTKGAAKGAKDCRPVTVPDVSLDPSLASLRNVFAAEGIRALAFIPLCLDTGLFGQFMLYYDAPHTFTLDELDAAQAIAAHVALAAQRRQAELDRARTEHRLQAILDNSPLLMFLKDLQGRYVFMNRRYHGLFHFTPEGALGRTDFDLFPREFAERYIENDRSVLASGFPLSIEERAQQDDGIHTYISVKFPIYDQDGSVNGVCGISTDITESLAKQEELRRAKRQVDDILASIRESFVALDREWRFTYVNDRVVAQTNMTRDKLIGANFWELFPHTRETFREGFERCMRERVPVQFEATLRGRKTGENFHFEVHAYPTDEGISAYILDINERKKAEESARQLAGIVEATTDLVAITRVDGSIFYMNRAGRAMLGISSEPEAARMNYQAICPDWVYIRSQQEWLPTAMREGSVSGEAAVLGGNGREIPVSFVTLVHRDSQGVVDYISIIARDISQSKQVEDALRKANAELEEFAYVSSHDLQEPLRTVNVYSQLLLQRFGSDDPEAALFAKFINQGVQRMERLIRDLLAYSRVIHGETVETTCADLSEALQQAMETLKTRIEETGAKISAGALPMVRGEATYLAQVFQNLLSNSLKYRRTDRELHISISAEVARKECIVCVRDNGIGFEQQYAERIFRLFQRLHRDEYAGTGLGLAICQRIIERYGGRIWAEGSQGKGAAFYFALPTTLP